MKSVFCFIQAREVLQDPLEYVILQTNSYLKLYWCNGSLFCFYEFGDTVWWLVLLFAGVR